MTFAGHGRIPQQKGNRGVLVPRLVISMNIQPSPDKHEMKLYLLSFVIKSFVVISKCENE
ncbi:hypothetical protein EK904_002104 [Melospiza melodia maxima]|nr:hypothetical protein EK904_002104 [Melospiza melodia maxima]